MCFARLSLPVLASDIRTEPDLSAWTDEIMAEIEKGQQLADHFPSKEALDRGRRVLVGELSISDARRELRVKHTASGEMRMRTHLRTHLYAKTMTSRSLPTSRAVPVLSFREARDELGRAVGRFREDANAEILVFGSHRRAEAAIVPIAVVDQLLSRLDDEEIAALVRERWDMESESLSDVAARFGVVLDES
jgi:hypothetical protein